MKVVISSNIVGHYTNHCMVTITNMNWYVDGKLNQIKTKYELECSKTPVGQSLFGFDKIRPQLKYVCFLFPDGHPICIAFVRQYFFDTE